VIIFTKHALERVKQHAITRDDVVQVLTNSKERTKDILGHPIRHGTQNFRARISPLQAREAVIVSNFYRERSSSLLVPLLERIYR